MTGKIFKLCFADTGLFNKSCTDRIIAACVFFSELEQFLSQNSRLWMPGFSKYRMILSSLMCENMQWVFPPLLLAHRTKHKGSWILFSADFCRGQVVKPSNPFCASIYAWDTYLLPTCPENKHSRNWDACAEGIKSKRLLLSGCASLGTAQCLRGMASRAAAERCAFRSDAGDVCHPSKV